MADVRSNGKSKFLKKIKYQHAGQQLVMVGDEPRDVIAAKKAEVMSVALEGGLSGNSGLVKSRPDFIARDCKELKQILLGII